MSSRSPASRPFPVLVAAFFLGLSVSAQRPEAAPQGAEPAPERARELPDALRSRGGADPSDDAFELGSPPSLPDGMPEEAMWPAATAEGWKRPVLVRWQRTFDDALRVANAENRPILVCVNMDGEIASEHFAGVRYRQPETAEAMNRYACVIASVYRHTPRDYDPEGRRVPCPRFGTVTCGEHVEAERELYGRYFDGTRVAPRHIVLGLEGEETYDVYYSWDTATVFTTFRKGVEGWPDPVEPVEPTLMDLVASPDVDAREAVEKEYFEGDRETRRALLVQLAEQHVVDQTEVLRAALFGLDLELATIARRALAECETEGALDLMAEALKAPLDASEKDMLLDAVARLAARSPRARTLAAVHDGLSLQSRFVDARPPEELAREYEANAERTSIQARAEAAEARPNDPAALLELAEALVARAQEAPERRYAVLLLEDARGAAADAERLGASGPRLDGVVAIAAAELGDLALARERAVRAVEGGLLRPDDGASETEAEVSTASRIRILRLFADARQRAIREAYRSGGTWPPEWLSDVTAAYASVAADPAVAPETLVDYHDFLRWIGASPRANAVLDDALARFPSSALLHERLRGRLLWERGPEGLERGYEERLARAAEPGELTWFAGYAELVAAEHYRRRTEPEAALRAYERGIELYGRTAESLPEERDTCQHFIALAHAGRARVALERGELDAATRAMLAGLRARPDSAATPDGLNITPVATAKMLLTELREANDAERAAWVQDALDALDPKLLEPPPSELPAAGRRGRAGARSGR